MFLIVGSFVLRAPTAGAFSIAVHQAITKDQLKTVTATVSGQPVKFSARALEQIAKENVAMDSLLFPQSAALYHPERHFTNETFPESSARLIQLRQEIVMKLTASPPDGDKARTLLGNALHAVQDFYAHSNWVELPGHLDFNHDLGRQMMTRPPLSLHTCPTNPDTLGGSGGGGLTSAYFVSPLGLFGVPQPTNGFRVGCEPSLLPTGKCFHGNEDPRDPGTVPCSGINKDEPGRPFHSTARSTAEPATVDYVQQIVAAIAGNDKAIAALFDVKGTIGFVIDDTGSMGSTINGVKTLVGFIVHTINVLPSQRPDNWLLERFGDPGFGPAFVTESADTLLGAVGGLSANGGGDCPELSQDGLLEAIGKSFPDSTLFMFSDASAKDSVLANNVISEAHKKNIRIVYVLTGSCSPIDPAYVKGAAETGGQLFFVNPSEVPSLSDLLIPQLAGNLQRIRSATGVFSGPPEAFDIPVDSTISRLLISTSADTQRSASLQRPDGSFVAPSDPDAHITHLSSGDIFVIDHPAFGSWRIAVEGSGHFTVAADGNSAIEFRRFDFVQPNPDVHGGYFPVPGLPLLGSEAIGEATLLGPFMTGSFKLVAAQGSEVKTVNLVQNFPRAPADHFLGGFELPAFPFRVVAVGQDPLGFTYQREFAAVYRAQTIEVVSAEPNVVILKPGSVKTIHYKVRNLGSDAVFNLVASSSLGSIISVSPTSVSLNHGNTANVSVDVVVPLGTLPGSAVSVTLVASRAGDPDSLNSATVPASVGNPDSDGDGVPDDEDSCPSSNLTPTVIIDGCNTGVTNIVFANGCSIFDKISAIAATSRNHGQFVSGVAHLTSEFVRTNQISGTEKGRIDSCAARARIP